MTVRREKRKSILKERKNRTATVPRASIPAESGFRISLRVVLPLLALFIATRLVFLLNFPIFNDEANFIQYAQHIHKDWDTYKFITVNSPYLDWKPPLAFWIGSFFLGLAEDPLLSVRLASVSISVIGFLSIYAFSGYFFDDRRKAFWTGFLWLMNPMVLFYDREFVAETFVYSFSAATLLFTYFSISGRRLYFVIPAILFGAMTLLTKQSGQLTMVNLFFLTALLVDRDRNTGKRYATDYRKIGVIFLIVVCSWGLYRLVIPSQYFQNYERFSGMFTFSLSELAKFPMTEWWENIKRIAFLYSNYYSVVSVLLIMVSVYFACKKACIRELLIIALFAFNSAVIVLYFRTFNEYVYNTSTVMWLTLVLCSAVANIYDAFKQSISKNIRLVCQYGAPVLLILMWAYPMYYYYGSAREYILRVGTPHMREHYFFGWPGGFYINDVISLLKEEKNKIVLVDPQWGNPRTSIEIYSHLYPSLQIVRINPQIIEIAPRLKPDTVIAIFKNKPGADWADYFLSLPIWKEKRAFQWDERQTPLMYCRN